MKRLHRIYLTFFSITFIFGSIQVDAQDKAAAIKAFNQALETAKSNDYQRAIALMEQSVSISEKIGAEGDATKKEAIDRLPGLYFSLAGSIYKKKDLDGAITAFEQAKNIAVKYDDTRVADRATGIIPQLYYAKGNSAFKRKQLENAIVAYDAAISANPNYAKAYYGKALVYKNTEDIDNFTSSIEKAIEIGTTSNDKGTVRKAEQSASEYFTFRGANLTQDKVFKEGERMLRSALVYDNTNPDTYYRLAENYNKQSRFQEAIDMANEALKYEKGGKSASAKIYFELGTAYKYLGNKARACESLENAAFGSFTQSARYEMEHNVKCGSNS